MKEKNVLIIVKKMININIYFKKDAMNKVQKVRLNQRKINIHVIEFVINQNHMKILLLINAWKNVLLIRNIY